MELAKKIVGQRSGITCYRGIGAMYSAWHYVYSVFDDGSERDEYYVVDGLYRQKLPWETEEVTLVDVDGTKKLVRVIE